MNDSHNSCLYRGPNPIHRTGPSYSYFFGVIHSINSLSRRKLTSPVYHGCAELFIAASFESFSLTNLPRNQLASGLLLVDHRQQIDVVTAMQYGLRHETLVWI